MHDFHLLAGFPGVLGVIDCTHVAIQSPGGNNAELYRNRKGYFSLNVQCVANANLLFENVVARWYGSAHDATIFSNSRLCARFQSGEIHDSYLLGDAGYPCRQYLLTPLAATGTNAEHRYNYSQIRTRNPIERAFGVLKRRFPCLRMGLRVRVVRACTIVVACTVLHNACIRAGDNQAPDDTALVQGRHAYEEIPAVPNNNIVRGAATAARTALIDNFFTQ